MKAKRSNLAGVIALLVVGAAGVYAVGFYVAKTPEAQKIPTSLRRDSQEVHHSKPADQTTSTEKSSAVVLTPQSKNGELSFDSATEDVPEGTNKMVFAVNRYLENSHILPSGARSVGAEMEGDMACIDLTEAAEKSVGSSDEMTLIKGLGKTLSQFPGVKRMKFLVSGKAIDSWGNVDMSQGLDVTNPDDSATKPGESTTPPGG